jgi:regulator of protease activity HflC (stomatin/prohibitin superfamily)
MNNELPPQQATGYQDSRLTGSGASSGELTRCRTEPSSARHGSSVTLVQKIFLSAIFAATVCCVAGCSGRGGLIVDPGNVALLINHYSGKIDPHVRHAGWNAQPPFSGNEVIEIPTYLRTYTMVKDSKEGAHIGDDSVTVQTLSSNTLNVDCSVTYHIAFDPQHEERIISLYQKYRSEFSDFDDFEEHQLRPAFRQAIVDAFGLNNTDVAMTGDGKRAAAAYALNQLNTRFNPDSIVVDEVRIRTIYPDAQTVQTLLSRLQAQQNLRIAQLNMELQSINNQKAVLKAQADAQAAHIRAASLTPRLVAFHHIKDWNIEVVPSGSIVNIPPDSSSQ